MKDSAVKKNRDELIGRLALAIRASQNASDAYDEHVDRTVVAAVQPERLRDGVVERVRPHLRQADLAADRSHELLARPLRHIT